MAIVLLAGLICALLTLAPSSEDLTQGHEALVPPGWPHVLGTDRLGRDVLTVTAIGTGRSLSWAGLVLFGSAVIGLLLGLMSATIWKSPLDEALQIVAESIRSFPAIVAALLFLLANVPVPLLLIAYFWIPIWRVVRIQVGAQRFRPYVLNAILFGRSRFGALAWHALPNATTGIRGVVFVVFAEIVSVQAGLEFLGFSTPLSEPTLGNIISEAIRLGVPYAWTWLPATLMAGAITIWLFASGQKDAAYLVQRLE